MRRIAIVLAMLIAITVNAQEKPHIMLVMHGGAGTITRGSMTAEMEKQYRDTLEQALKTGQGVQQRGDIPGMDRARWGTARGDLQMTFSASPRLRVKIVMRGSR
jgi:hypothetical protein